MTYHDDRPQKKLEVFRMVPEKRLYIFHDDEYPASDEIVKVSNSEERLVVMKSVQRFSNQLKMSFFCILFVLLWVLPIYYMAKSFK